MKLLPNIKALNYDEKQEVMILQYKGEGFVTINFKRRGFSLGHGSHSPTMSGYTGTGWRQKLGNAAMKELTEVYK